MRFFFPALSLSLSLCLLSFGASALAQDYVLSPNLTATDAQVRQFSQLLTHKLPQDQFFFHWADIVSSLRWAKTGRIDASEIAELDKGFGLAGGGFYLASDSTSSMGYGPFPVVVKIQAGVPLYDEGAATQVFGRALTVDEKAQLGQYVPFIHYYQKHDAQGKTVGNSGPKGINPPGSMDPLVPGIGWYVTHSAANLQEMYSGLDPRFGTRFDAGRTLWNSTLLSTSLQKVVDAYAGTASAAKVRDLVGYLDSFLQLFDYQGPLVLNRSVRFASGNPWGEFDAAHFEAYRSFHKFLGQNASQAVGTYTDPRRTGISMDVMDVYSKYFTPTIDSTTAALIQRLEDTFSRYQKDLAGGMVALYWDSEEKPEPWSHRQVEAVLPKIWSGITGQDPARLQYRNEAVRIGGTEVGQRMFVTASQLKVLQANPYLEVESTPAGTGYLVDYFHPDVFHCAKLVQMGRVSPALVAQIRKYTPDQLSKDAPTRQALNSALIRELLLDLFRRIYGLPANLGTISGVSALQDLSSIRPFSEFSERITDLYVEAAHLEAGADMPRSLIPELRLLTETTRYRDFLKASNDAIAGLRSELVGEFVRVMMVGGQPNYFGLPGWQNLTGAFSALGGVGLPPLDAQDFEFIRQRQFSRLLVKDIPNFP